MLSNAKIFENFIIFVIHFTSFLFSCIYFLCWLGKLEISWHSISIYLCVSLNTSIFLYSASRWIRWISLTLNVITSPYLDFCCHPQNIFLTVLSKPECNSGPHSLSLVVMISCPFNLEPSLLWHCYNNFLIIGIVLLRPVYLVLGKLGLKDWIVSSIRHRWCYALGFASCWGPASGSTISKTKRQIIWVSVVIDWFSCCS